MVAWPDQIGYLFEQHHPHHETFEDQKTWIDYKVLGQISGATKRQLSWQNSEGCQLGTGFGIGLVVLGIAKGLGIELSPK